jgi:hypothetical protein
MITRFNVTRIYLGAIVENIINFALIQKYLGRF